MAKKILVVDDESPLRNALIAKLSHEGYETEGASYGSEALEMLKTFKPDLLLLDFVMPVKDGAEVLREMQKDSDLRKIKVIMLTNLSDPTKSYEATDIGEGILGPTDYLVKSDWKLDEVLDKIKQKIG